MYTRIYYSVVMHTRVDRLGLWHHNPLELLHRLLQMYTLLINNVISLLLIFYNNCS